jgi:metal-responsive CopG/Arc/MetJ family transcriptional regulator
MKTKVVTISLPEPLMERVDSAVEEFKRSRSNLVMIALENMLTNSATSELARQLLVAPGGEKRVPPA